MHRLAGAALAIVPLLSAFAARAQDSALGDWIPAFGIASSFVGVGGSGALSSSVRPSAFDDRDVQFPIYGVSLSLASPPLAPIPAAPRIWGQIGLASGLREGQNLAREGAPAKLELPPQLAGPPLPEAGVAGQGSSLEASFGSYFLSGGLGTRFDFELLERRVSVTPSFEWAIFQLRVEGVANRAFRGIGTPFANTRFVSLQAFGRKVLRGVGPGLEIELEASRFGPFVSSVYISGQGYRLFGDRERKLSARFVDNTGTETAEWHARFHRWTYRGGLGLRLHWQPE